MIVSIYSVIGAAIGCAGIVSAINFGFFGIGHYCLFSGCCVVARVMVVEWSGQD
jgi:hypothetical protein